MSKFQQQTAIIKFFRDLRDAQEEKKCAFEASSGTSRREDDPSQTVFQYDIRTDVVHNIKDEADRNLLYNITQFLLDSRASLAGRLEEQRVRQSLPEGADFFRVCSNVEDVMRHFQVRRRTRQCRRGGEQLHSGSEGFAIGIDQQTFVDVFTDVLRAEADRVMHYSDELDEGAAPQNSRDSQASTSQKRRSSNIAASPLMSTSFSGAFVSEQSMTIATPPKGSGKELSVAFSPSPVANRRKGSVVSLSTGGGDGQPQASPDPPSQRPPTRVLSTVGGRSERRMLLKLFDEMDSDNCGVVSWDTMVEYMARLRLGGQERIEVQREGELRLTTSSDMEPVRIGSGKAATAAIVQHVPALAAVLTMYERASDESSHVQKQKQGDGTNKKAASSGSTTKAAVHSSTGGEPVCSKVLELYATQDHRLMHQRQMPASTTVVVYLPLEQESSKKGGPSGAGGFFGAFSSSGSFQAFRLQLQLARGTVDLIPSHSPIQLGHSPAYALYNSLTKLLFGASLQGTLFAYEPMLLSRPQRITAPARLYNIFEEPTTCMIASPDETKIFLSCLFGGIAVYQPVKDYVSHRFTAQFGNLREPCGIRTMAYIAESNVLITGGPSSALQVWMATPCRNVEPHVSTLEHESDPHRDEVMRLWVDPSLSTNAVASLDRSGVMKLWDVSRGLVLGTFSVGDGLGYHVFAAAPAMTIKGTLFFVGNSTRTHRCFLDRVCMCRKMVNPVAVARVEGVQHHRSLHLIRDEEQVLSAVDGSILTYDVKTGRMLQFFPNVFGKEAKRITSLAPTLSAKKVFAATEDGDLMSFCLLSGEHAYSLRPFPRSCEVSALVLLESQGALVAACRPQKGDERLSVPAVRVYAIPDRDPESRALLDFMCEITIPGKRGVVTMCERTYNDTCSLVVLWDTAGGMHQLSVEGTRVMISTAVDCRRVHRSAGGNAPLDSVDCSTEDISDSSPPAGGAAANLSAAEVNFATETAILTLLEATTRDSMCEVKCGADLHPFPFVASADSASRLHLWTAAPMDLCRAKTWDHFSPRKIVAGVNKAVVAAVAFSPSPLPQLITADDHGCIALWDLTAFLEHAGCRVATPRTLGDAFHRQGGAASSPFSLSSVPDVAEHFGSIEVPLLHCFHVSTASSSTSPEPLMGVFKMKTTDAYCVGLSFGSTRFVSMTGSVVGELIADPKYMIEDPPRYFLNKITEVEEMKKPKKRTRGGELWAKLRGSVLGDAKVMALGVKELLSRARNAVDFAVHDNGNSSDDEPTTAARTNDDDVDDEGDVGNASSSKQQRIQTRYPYACTPCNTPSGAKHVANTLRVPANVHRSECLIDPLRSDVDRHPVTKAFRTPLAPPTDDGGVIDETETGKTEIGQTSTSASVASAILQKCDGGVLDTPIEMMTTKTLSGVRQELERLVGLVEKQQSCLARMRAKPTTGSSAALMSSISLAKFYKPPPPLFAPSVFKALRRPEISLPPLEDRPAGVQKWIGYWIDAFENRHHVHHQPSHVDVRPVKSAVGQATSGDSSASLFLWCSHNVPQQTMPLQTLNLPNHLLVKYWSPLEEEDNVPPLHMKGCSVEQPSITPMPTRRGGARCRQQDEDRTIPTGPPQESPRPSHTPPEEMSVPPVMVPNRSAGIPPPLSDALLSAAHTATLDSRPASTHTTDNTPHGPSMLEVLLHASTSLYPLHPSPFLDPGRVPPTATCNNTALHCSSIWEEEEESAVSGPRQQRPTSSASSYTSGGHANNHRSRPTSSLGRAMSAVRQRATTSCLHPNFLKAAIALAVSPDDPITDVGPQKRNWGERTLASRPFARDVQRQQGGYGGHAGRIAKLRCSNHHTPLVVNESVRSASVRAWDEEETGFHAHQAPLVERRRPVSCSPGGPKKHNSLVDRSNPTALPRPKSAFVHPQSGGDVLASGLSFSEEQQQKQQRGTPSSLCGPDMSSLMILSSTSALHNGDEVGEVGTVSAPPRPLSALKPPMGQRMSSVAKQRLVVARVKL